MAAQIIGSTITNTAFQSKVQNLDIQNATIDRCNFKGLINNASITGTLTKCQFEGLSNNITIHGPLQDMTVQTDLTPTSAKYVQKAENPSELIGIGTLIIDSTNVPRLAELPHKECFINVINPGNKIAFIVQLSTDVTNPHGVILMFYPGSVDPGKTIEEIIPKGYAVCNGQNGTPDLRGRFIRSAESDGGNGIKLSDVTYHDNTKLTNNGYGTRIAYVTLEDINLPDHEHQLDLTFDQIHLNVTTSNAFTNQVISVPYYSTGTESVGTEGESLINIKTINSTSTDDYQLQHSHDIDTYLTVTPHIQWVHDPDYKPTPINIEPNSYALIFIMKL